MTKKLFQLSSFVLFAAGLTMTAASCTNEDENSVTPDKKGLVSVEIRSGINGGRTALNGTDVVFQSGDKLAVWDGEAKREFTTDKGGSVAVFKGEIAENASQLNILYPFSAGKDCDGTTITATIPAKQTTTKDSFDPSANLAVATATYTKGQNITCTLENVCGLLKFTIASDAAKAPYDSIKIAGKDNEKIAGEVTITNKQIDAASGNATTVTLGDATNKLKKDSTYYVVLKPGTFASGLKMTFYSGGKQVDGPMTIVSTKTTGGGFEIKPGVILNAGEVKPDPVFSVSNDGGTTITKVKFAPGNLQATYQSDGTYKWGFAEHQWDYIGGRSAGGFEPETGNNWIDNQHDGAIVDHFGWTAISKNYDNDGIKQYGINTSQTAEDYGNDVNDQCCDWGSLIGSGWRILTNAEWGYLLNTRKVTVGGAQRASYGEGKVNGVNGLIILPDNWDGSVSDFSYESKSFDNNIFNETTTPKWSAMESAGCVFLPCAGFRKGSSMISVGSLGHYWSSSPNGSPDLVIDAHNVGFLTDFVLPQNTSGRYSGFSVRLVRSAE